jgi:glycosyltransferase involved in cell wall biosynthesis
VLKSDTMPAAEAAPDAPLRVLGLTAHPVRSPGPRYRVYQFVEPLREHGIDLDVRSFTRPEDYGALFEPGHRARKLRWLVEGTLRRSLDLARARKYDAILVQVWLHPMSFPPFDVALRLLDTPLVYDIDDAYFLPRGRGSDLLRRPDWLPSLMRRAHSVLAGSEFIAEFCRKHSGSVRVLHTAIDTDRFSPRPPDARPRPVVGWIGTHSTFPFVEELFPVFEDLARDHEFVLRLVGAGQGTTIPGVTVETLPWTLEREVDYFRDLDVGLYPVIEGGAAQAKFGFKLHQYMSVGVAAVASDIGVNRQLVSHGKTAFLAGSPVEWKAALSDLIRSPELRHRVGAAARENLAESYSLRATSRELAQVLRAAARTRG